MRFIERNYGRLEKCGCQKQTRYPKPQDEPRLYCALLARDEAGRVRQNTECRLYGKGWLVWQPDAAGYQWAEIVEINKVESLLARVESNADADQARSLDDWEQLGRGEVNFRVCPLDDFSQESFSRRLRVSVVREVLQRNPKFSHVNLVTDEDLFESSRDSVVHAFSAGGLSIEKLRNRLIPSWQSGDMAIRTFTTYTITRKDISAADSALPHG
jgi:hypothetical protein